MCGIVGIVNLKQDFEKNNYKNVLINMTEEISKRGPDEDGYFIDTHVCFGHKRLIVVDPDGGKQPMTFKYNNNTYTIIYNGQLYNTKELKEELIENGFTFASHSDTEVLLKSYIHFGYEVVNKLNGIFAFSIWDSKKEELFMARDHFGVKPLYYTINDNTLIFASEIKSILKFPNIESIVDKTGICELFGLRSLQYSWINCF